MRVGLWYCALWEWQSSFKMWHDVQAGTRAGHVRVCFRLEEMDELIVAHLQANAAYT